KSFSDMNDLFARIVKSRAVEDTTREIAGHLTVGENRLAVHQHVAKADSVLVWMSEVGLVGNCRGIEDGDVGLHAGAQQAAVENAKAPGGQAGHAADGLFERENFPLAHVAAEDASEGPIVARMRDILAEERNAAVGSNHGPGVAKNALEV